MTSAVHFGNRKKMDHLSKEKRSWNMSRIRSKNTKPELLVRSALHSMGYRFRLNGKVSKKYCSKGVLPGKPDIVLAKYKLVIFIHGCFWHCHNNCKHFRLPKSRTGWWEEKLNKNKMRDIKNMNLLREMGWTSLVIWECEINKGKEKLTTLIQIRLQEIISFD